MQIQKISFYNTGIVMLMHKDGLERSRLEIPEQYLRCSCRDISAVYLVHTAFTVLFFIQHSHNKNLY